MADFSKNELVDRAAGLELSYGSQELYDSILEAYLEEYDDNVTKLAGFLADKNWKEYRVIAHSIKSNSKQIGANELFEEALKMEMAAKEENAEAVAAGHDSLIKDYSHVVEYIKNGFSLPEEPETKETSEFTSEATPEPVAEIQEESQPESKTDPQPETEGSARPVPFDSPEVFFYDGLLPGYIERNDALRQDIVIFLEEAYFKILRINLTTNRHEDLLVKLKEANYSSGYSENIEEWLKGFAREGGVHPDDVESYLKRTDFVYLKNHFDNTNEDLIIRYRRAVEGDYRWVNMVLRKSVEYTPTNQYVMLYIQDVDRQITQDAKINAAFFEAFNIYVSGKPQAEIIEDLLAQLCSFYGACGSHISRVGKDAVSTILYSYGMIGSIAEDDWVQSFELDKKTAVILHRPGDNTNTRVVLRAIMMLIQIIFNKEQEEKYEQNLENQLRIIGGLSDIYFCVYIVDTRTHTTQRVHSAEYLDKLFGDSIDPKEILQKMETFLVEEEFKETIHKFNDIDSWGEKLKVKNDISMEFRGPTKGWARVNVIVSQRDEAGVPVEFIYTVREINDMKKREEKYNQSLKDALEYANRANKAKSQFLSNVSHDIRTPMNAIVGFTTLATTHIDDKEKVKEYLENIATAGKHLMGLINDVLDMSRIESGRMEIRQETFDLVEMVEDVRTMNASLTENKNIDFEVDTTGVIHRNIISDSLRFNQVLINIVGNAIKFTKPGGMVGITVTEDKTKTDTAMYRFVIKDTGIGMDADFLEKIFDPFERERTATESRIEGTGLGLAIVKNIVELMGGNIRVESKKGEGSQFYIDVPFKLSLEEASNQDKENNVVSDIDITKLKILLVEDNEINRKIARAIFADKNMTLDEAFNGQEAVDTLIEKGAGYYDLVLMDVQMPVMNGYEATAKIRSLPDEGLSQIPIIAMTANAFEEDKRASLKAGMNAHISKPIDIDILMDTIKSVM